MPPNPKRPARGQHADQQILRADDPRPQRVAQLPSSGTSRRPRKEQEYIPTSVFDTEADQEMQAEYGVQGGDYKPAFLYVERGPGAGQLLEVKQGSVVVGRASVSDLRLQHPSISRRHTQIRRLGEQFFVKDLGSQNGTFVNKERIAAEVEVRPGDSIAMGNALLRLRGPLVKGELPAEAPAPAPATERSPRARISTAVVARPTGPQAAPSTTALKIAVFAGAVGFSLAAVLAFALVKTMSNAQPADKGARRSAAASPSDERERARLIDEAIERKMAEKSAAAAVARDDEEYVQADGEVTVTEQVKAPTVAKAPVVTAAPRVASASTKRSAAKSTDDEEDATPSARPAPKRAQILAAYEKGNAEASLEAAKKAGDRELSDKLSRFIAAYDAATDAMMSNNGSAAIANFQKALSLDEQLSSGWGKYGGEIRKQLANLYTLVGLQFVSTGDTEKAKTAFQAAVKHDPNNQRAKAQLAKLQPAAAKSVDDAFEDDAPAAKPAPRRAVAPKSAIDDAFGD